MTVGYFVVSRFTQWWFRSFSEATDFGAYLSMCCVPWVMVDERTNQALA